MYLYFLLFSFLFVHCPNASYFSGFFSLTNHSTQFKLHFIVSFMYLIELLIYLRLKIDEGNLSCFPFQENSYTFIFTCFFGFFLFPFCLFYLLRATASWKVFNKAWDILSWLWLTQLENSKAQNTLILLRILTKDIDCNVILLWC